MKAIITLTVTKEIEIPDDSLSTDAANIICTMTHEELFNGAVPVYESSVLVRLPHCSFHAHLSEASNR